MVAVVAGETVEAAVEVEEVDVRSSCIHDSTGPYVGILIAIRIPTNQANYHMASEP